MEEQHTAERPRRGVRDLAISLLVLLVPVLLVVVGYQVVYRGNEPIPVDPSAVIDSAQEVGFDITTPLRLDDRWVSVSAQFRRADGATLRLGYVTPGRDGVQLVQSTVPVERLLPAELTPDARRLGVAEIEGRSWLWYATRPGERALVLMGPEHTTIVIGGAPVADLRELAAALR